MTAHAPGLPVCDCCTSRDPKRPTPPGGHRALFGQPGAPICVVPEPWAGRRAEVLVENTVHTGHVLRLGEQPARRAGLSAAALRALPSPAGEYPVCWTGPEVRTRTVNPDGNVVFDPAGVQVMGPKAGGGTERVRLEDGCVLQIRFVA